MFLRLLQPLKAPAPMEVTDDGRLIDDRCWQSQKARHSIDVIDDGMSIDDILELLNASTPIL